MKKKKITAYANVFAHKLDKLKDQIRKFRKEGEVSKEHAKRLIKEAKALRDLLKELVDED